MQRISEILIDSTKKVMDFHKRQATGEAVLSMREVRTKDGLQIVGVDYWKQINEGTPKGTLIPLSDIQRWIQAKEGRYSVKLPSAKAIQTSILNNGAPKNKQGLRITTQVVNTNTQEIKEAAYILSREYLKL
mgnify:CR=1 FL=1